MQQHMATALFGVDGVEVVEVDVELSGEVTVWLATGDQRVPVCPRCGTVAGRVHERVVTRPRDLGLGDQVAVMWLKRRWKCGDAGCGQVTFTESVPQIPSRARLTERLREQTAALIADQEMSVAAASRAAGVSWPTAHQAFTRSADAMLAGPMAAVDVLGIDETRRGRPRWHKDPDTGEYVLDADRWHTGFVDVSGDQGMLGQVEGRTADDTSYWLHQAGPAWRQRVRVVVIDMCTIYASAIRRMLPHAVLAVDPFHVVQLATKMVGDVRRRAVREKYGRRGRSGDIEYGCKNLLVKNLEHLRPGQLEKIIDVLERDRHGQQILAAWIAKEKLRDLIRLRATFTGSTPAPSQIRHALADFYSWCADHDDIPEIATLAKTIDRWSPGITAAILLGVSNAKSEGLNRVAKLEARKAYGFRNPANQRRRVRTATTRPSRRPRSVTKRRSHRVTGRKPNPG